MLGDQPRRTPQHNMIVEYSPTVRRYRSGNRPEGGAREAGGPSGLNLVGIVERCVAPWPASRLASRGRPIRRTSVVTWCNGPPVPLGRRGHRPAWPGPGRAWSPDRVSTAAL